MRQKIDPAKRDGPSRWSERPVPGLPGAYSLDEGTDAALALGLESSVRGDPGRLYGGNNHKRLAPDPDGDQLCLPMVTM